VRAFVLGLLGGLSRTDYWTLAEHHLQQLFAAPSSSPLQPRAPVALVGVRRRHQARTLACHYQRQATQDHGGHELRLEY
jgi:hypothetical protein